MAVATSELSILVRLRDEASSAFGKLSGSLKKAEDASRGFAVGLLAGGTAVAGLGGLALKAASDAEQTSVAFTTMLGSAEKAQSFIAEMKKFANKTPFETADIAKASQTMLAFGMNVEDVMPNVKMIGDVALGNKEKFASLSLAFSQVQATGRLMGQDLLQMVNQGFNPLTIMSKKTGKSMQELKDDMEKGKISADMVTDAFRTATSEGGRFYKGMEAQSTTLSGIWSTLSDAFNEFLRTQGEKFLPAIKAMVLEVTNFVNNVLPQWIGKIQELIGWLDQHKTVLYVVAGAIIGGLVPAVYAAVVAFGAAAIALAPFIIGGAIIGGLVAGIIWIVKHWEDIRAKAVEIWTAISNFFKQIWNGIKSVFEFYIGLILGIVITIFNKMGIDIVAIWNNSWATIKTVLSATWESIKSIVSVSFAWLAEAFKAATEPLTKLWDGLWSALGGTVSSVWEGVKSTIVSSINWIIDKINSLINSMNSVASKGASVAGFKAPQVPTIPKLAEGGIVTRPTIALIGEAGPEAVIPLSGNRGISGGTNITINISGNTLLDRDSARKMGDLIIKQLKFNYSL